MGDTKSLAKLTAFIQEHLTEDQQRHILDNVEKTLAQYNRLMVELSTGYDAQKLLSKWKDNNGNKIFTQDSEQ